MSIFGDWGGGAHLQDIAAGPGGGKPGFSLGNLFQNKLFLEMLAGAGQGIASGNMAAGVSPIVRQNVTNQNYVKYMSRMLSGDMPPGAKMTTDEEGITFKIPKQKAEGEQGGLSAPAFGGTPAVNPNPGSDEALAQFRNWMAGGQSPLSNANPFVSSQPETSAMGEFSPEDLAGLSPEMISNALQFKFAKDEMGQKRIMDVVNAMQSMALADYYGKLGGEAEARTGEMTPSVEVPGIGPMTRKEFVDWSTTRTPDERTADIKNFQFARTPEGGGYTGSFTDFADPQTTTDWKNYQLGGGAKVLGPYNKWLTEQNKSKAIQLTPAQRELSSSSVASRVLLRDPEKLNAIIAKRLADPTTAREMWRTSREDPKAATDLKADITVGEIDKIIETGGGKAKAHMSPDGKTMIWDIEWTNEDGTKSKETYRYAIY